MTEANPYAFLSYQANSPCVRLVGQPDCMLLSADSDARPFNTVFAPALAADRNLARRAQEITAHYTTSGRMPVWWMGPAAPRTAGPAGDGFQRLTPITLMDAPLDPVAERADPVRSAADLTAFASVLRAAHHAPAEMAEFTHRVLASLLPSERAPLQHIVVRGEDGEGVAVASVFLNGGVAGLYNVATVPEQRGKGYGTRAARATLGAAHDRGYRVAMLGAEPEAVGMYRRLGFVARGELSRMTPAP